MIRIVDFFTRQLGTGGNVIVAVIFFLLAAGGVVIAMRGRGAMVWLVGVCGFLFGVTAGAMVGLLCFNSLILMVVFAAVGGVLLLYTVKNAKSVGYFIGIGSLSWLLALIITSEFYMSNAKVTENTLLFIDFLIGLFMGILAACRSKYIVSVVTALAGGMITSISTLVILGYYFSDIKTWVLAGMVALAGLAVQIHTYDLRHKTAKPTKKTNKRK